MLTTTSIKCGDSFSIWLKLKSGQTFPADTKMLVYLGGVLIGSTTDNPIIIQEDGYYKIFLSSDDTFLMRGYRDLIIILDGTGGVKQTIVAGVLFERLPTDYHTPTENDGYNMLVEIDISNTITTTNVVLQNALKGDRGDPFLYEDFTEEQLLSLVGEKGDDGYTPYIQNNYWYINGVSTGIIAIGTNGTTPNIGENKNWFIGLIDTGILAEGSNGLDGKTAYQGAIDGGYVGSENSFNSDMALVSTKEDAGVAAQLILDLNLGSIITHNADEFIGVHIPVTYSQLTTLITNSQLIIGQKYLLTDYATTYTQPISNASLSGNTEPLLLTASSGNTLNPICSSVLFPQDQIYYNVVNDTSVVPGCTTGYIYRRIDTKKKNDIGFDYRQVKFRRWKLNVTTTDATGMVGVFGVGSVVNKTGTSEIYFKINNTPALFTVTSSWKRFEFDNLTYSSYSQYNWAVDNYNYSIPVSSDYMDYYMFSTNNTVNGAQSAYTNIYNNIFAGNTSSILTNNNSIFFGSSINDNTINSYFVSNTIGNSFTNNIIGMFFRYNSINSNFSFNNIKQLFYYNSIGNYFYLNNTDNYFYSNVVCDTCQYNNIGELSNKNKIGNSFTNNNIDVYFYSNLIGNYLSYNKIGRYFYSNTLLDNVYFQSNSIGNYFNTNNIGGYFQYNTCGDNFSNNTNEWESKYNTFGINFSYNYIQEVRYCTIGDNVRYNNISNSSGYYFSYNTIGNNVGGTSLIRKDLGNVTELVSKTYNHQITQTSDKVKIEWTDVYGDINIIRL